jgi:hypothetical protein
MTQEQVDNFWQAVDESGIIVLRKLRVNGGD